MISNKEINKSLSSLMGLPETYDVRREFRVIFKDLPLNIAEEIVNSEENKDIKHLFTITSSIPNNYCEDASLAIIAAKRISIAHDCTFVLSLEDGSWKASFGNWRDCYEYVGDNPAYCVCVAILKYMGRL